jgi:hypothetical protein
VLLDALMMGVVRFVMSLQGFISVLRQLKPNSDSFHPANERQRLNEAETRCTSMNVPIIIFASISGLGSTNACSREVRESA